jgi:polar amino acid transport system ATP-binding protein/sulfate transport system ATP-binding protein
MAEATTTTTPTTTAATAPATTPHDDVLLDVHDVWQNLGGTQILQGVTLQVKDRVRPGLVTGQVVALLGPSGVGKTRLIRLIAGLDRPDRGSICGVRRCALPAGSVGVVFQNYPLLRHRTVLDNLVVAGIANGLPRDEARAKAQALLKRFGLDNRQGFFPAQISGGQRQRVAIAQQLMRQKQLLLMDEPFSGLDPSSLDEVIKLLVEVANMDELNTIMVVTHDIRSALIASDTLFMLGRDRTPDGKIAGGARIERTYDLVAEGLAWRPGVERDPKFRDVEHEVKDRFRTL